MTVTTIPSSDSVMRTVKKRSINGTLKIAIRPTDTIIAPEMRNCPFWLETFVAHVAHIWSPVTMARVWNKAGSAKIGTKLRMKAVEKICRTVKVELTRYPRNG